MSTTGHPVPALPGVRHFGPVLATATLALTITTWGTLLYSTAATVVTAEFGLRPTAIGYLVALAFVSAGFCTLYAGSVTAAMGARRALVLAMLLTASGASLTTVGGLYGLAAGYIMFGSAHSLANPAGAVLLERLGNSRQRSIMFSVKQTGTPLGGLATALVTPVLAERLSWHWAGYVLTAVATTAALLTWIISRNWTATTPESVFSPNPFDGLRLVLRSPTLRLLAVVAICYSCVQICVITFLSPFMIEELGYSLILGGSIVAVAHVSGAAGRPFWGFAASRIGGNAAMLNVLGWIMVAALLPILLLTPDSPYAIVYLLVILLGSSTIGWNGIFAAEAASLAPGGKVSHATAGIMFFVFSAVLMAPPLFAVIERLVDSYGLAIALLSVAAVVGCVASHRLREASKRTEV